MNVAVHVAGLGSLGGSERVGSEAARASVSFDEAFWPMFLVAYNAALRILQDNAAAEDVAAEVLARVHVRWGRLGHVGYRDAWVVRAATNQALDVVRRGPPPAAEARSCTFEDDLTSRMVVLGAIHRLSRRQREVIALHYLVGLTEREVAESLGIAEGSVRRHIDRGLSGLRRGLDDKRGRE